VAERGEVAGSEDFVLGGGSATALDGIRDAQKGAFERHGLDVAQQLLDRCPLCAAPAGCSTPPSPPAPWCAMVCDLILLVLHLYSALYPDRPLDLLPTDFTSSVQYRRSTF
jgi:hypothetical protein